MMLPPTKCLVASLYTVVTVGLVYCNDENALSTNQIEDQPFTENPDIDADKRKWSGLTAWGKKRAWKTNFAAWGKRKWNNFAVWGKRDGDEGAAPSLPYEFAQPYEDKRAWAKFTSWGKRTSNALPISEFDDKRSKEEFQDPLNVDVNKRKWSQFASWGKRDNSNIAAEAEKRKWKQFAAWGKRDELDDMEKRKWSQFASWGKRADDLDAESDLQEADKRKWSQFASWGKRFEDVDTPEKRKWSQFASWGKRDNDELSLSNPDKRKWSQFASWGKRDGLSDEQPVTKRRWSQFASWGKRLRNARLAALSNWAKRRWTGLATWGKRSGNTSPVTEDHTDIIIEKLLNYFDANGDSALDKDELRHYINTLLYISSTQEEGPSQPPVEM